MGMGGILPKTAGKILGYVKDSFCMFSAASDGCEIELVDSMQQGPLFFIEAMATCGFGFCFCT